MKTFSYLIVVALFCCNGPKTCHGQEDGKSNVPLVMKIQSEYAGSCRKKELVIRGSLVNKTSEALAINPEAVLYRLSFSIIREDDGKIGSDNRTSIGHPVGNEKTPFLILEPDGAYDFLRRVNLDDRFFDTSGLYTVWISYGQFSESTANGVAVWKGVVDSNKATFRIDGCCKQIKER